MKHKAQGAIEYLLLIGAAVIIAVIVIALMMSISGEGTGAVEEAGLESSYSELELFKISQQTGLEFGKELDPVGDKGLSDGIVALWHFNELNCSAGICTMEDSSGNGYTATCVAEGCPTISPGLWGTNGMLFDGDNLFTLSNQTIVDLAPGTESFTLSAWFDYNPTGSCIMNYCIMPGIIATRRVNGGYNDMGFVMSFYKITTDGPLQYRLLTEFGDGTNKVTHGEPLANFRDGYNHFLVVRDKSLGQRRMYLNGVEVNGGTNSDPTGDISGAYLTNGFIGFSPVNWNDGYFRGTMEDIAIWHRALSDEEIENLYLKGITG